MREDEREQTLCRDQAVMGAVVIVSILWNGQDAVDEAWQRRVVQTIISWQTCLLSVVSSGTCFLPRLTRESCIEKVQPAREEECSNSDMLSTMTRSCTLYILAQLSSVHSPDQV